MAASGGTTMIGEKIKAIRMEKRITAKELAERVEVTPGYISQIERDLISPSLSVLMRIADAIETPLASLLSQEAREQVTVVRKDKRTKIRFADINIEYEFVTPYSRKGDVCSQMEMIRAKLGPKSWGSTIVQHHDEEGVYVGSQRYAGISHWGYSAYPDGGGQYLYSAQDVSSALQSRRGGR